MAASAAAASLRTVLVALYQKYIVGEVSAVRGDAALPAVDAATGALVFPVGVAPDEVAEEVAASRAFLESAVGALRLKIEADSRLQAQGAVRLTAENAQLLGEVNDLRRGLRFAFNALSRARESVGLPPLATPTLLAGAAAAGGDATLLPPAAAPAEVEGGPPRTPLPNAAAGGAATAAPPRAALTTTSAAFAASTRRTGAAFGVVGAAGTLLRPPSSAAAAPAPSPLAAAPPPTTMTTQPVAPKRPAQAAAAAGAATSRSSAASGAVALKVKLAELRVGGGSVVL
jgi:hypothetical protein